MHLSHIKGLSKTHESKLRHAGIRTQDSLLKNCCEPSKRRMIAKKTGISENRLIRWARQADMGRLRGLKEDSADLLVAAGANTLGRLRIRSAPRLYHRIIRLNKIKHITRDLPSLRQITGWIRQAQRMPAMIH